MTTNATQTFICPYCGERRDRAEQSLEHPLAQALGGGGFSSSDFCAPCNGKVGREIDQPFASHHVMVAMRHLFGVPDARGDIPLAPRLLGDIEGGGQVHLELAAA